MTDLGPPPSPIRRIFTDPMMRIAAIITVVLFAGAIAAALMSSSPVPEQANNAPAPEAAGNSSPSPLPSAPTPSQPAPSPNPVPNKPLAATSPAASPAAAGTETAPPPAESAPIAAPPFDPAKAPPQAVHGFIVNAALPASFYKDSSSGQLRVADYAIAGTYAVKNGAVKIAFGQAYARAGLKLAETADEERWQHAHFTVAGQLIIAVDGTYVFGASQDHGGNYYNACAVYVAMNGPDKLLFDSHRGIGPSVVVFKLSAGLYDTVFTFDCAATPTGSDLPEISLPVTVKGPHDPAERLLSANDFWIVLGEK